MDGLFSMMQQQNSMEALEFFDQGQFFACLQKALDNRYTLETFRVWTQNWGSDVPPTDIQSDMGSLASLWIRNYDSFVEKIEEDPEMAPFISQMEELREKSRKFSCFFLIAPKILLLLRAVILVVMDIFIEDGKKSFADLMVPTEGYSGFFSVLTTIIVTSITKDPIAWFKRDFTISLIEWDDIGKTGIQLPSLDPEDREMFEKIKGQLTAVVSSDAPPVTSSVEGNGGGMVPLSEGCNVM